MDLANQLQIKCKARGWTISILARQSGVPQATLHGWTTGRSVKNIDDLKKVSIVLQTSIHMLFYGEPDPMEIQTIDIRKFFSGEIKLILQKVELDVKKPP